MTVECLSYCVEIHYDYKGGFHWNYYVHMLWQWYLRLYTSWGKIRSYKITVIYHFWVTTLQAEIYIHTGNDFKLLIEQGKKIIYVTNGVKVGYKLQQCTSTKSFLLRQTCLLYLESRFYQVSTKLIINNIWQLPNYVFKSFTLIGKIVPSCNLNQVILLTFDSIEFSIKKLWRIIIMALKLVL